MIDAFVLSRHLPTCFELSSIIIIVRWIIEGVHAKFILLHKELLELDNMYLYVKKQYSPLSHYLFPISSFLFKLVKARECCDANFYS